MSSTSGTPYYSSRSMNGINQISVINENITDLENKTQDITYNDLTDTTTIVNNTQFYNTTINSSLTASNVKLTDNSIDMSNNGTYTFIDDGVSAQIVDTIHNQTIGGSKTFTGSVDINTLTIDSTTYPDGSTQTSANYLTPIQVNATDRITATNSMETHELTCVELYCNTINISDKIIDANNTGTAPSSFIYNATTMAYKTTIVDNIPLLVSVGDRVKSNGIGLEPFGDAGLQIATINTTNRIITFNPAGNFSLSIPPPIITSSLLAITSTSTFTSYISLGGYVGSGIRGTGTSANQPFLNAIVSPYNYSTPTASLTYSPDTTKTGYINSNSRLVSLGTYSNQNFISMTGISNPSYISGQIGTTAEYTISSQNPITPNTITNTFLAVPITPTLLTYPTFTGANTDFITQLNNITAGTKSTNNTGTGVLTLSLSHSPPSTTLTIVSGYVSSNSLKLETITALNQYVTGTGTASNGIPSNINSFISAVPTAPSSQYTIRSGTGTLSATNTNSSAIEGYTRFTSPNYFFISTTQLIDNYFIQATGVPQATRTRDPIAPYASQSNIMRLTQLNGYTPTATATSFVFTGIVANATQIKITSAPLGFSSGFMLENATSIPTSFNSLIPNGTKNTAWDSTNQIITCSGLTASTASLTNLKGYMRTTTLFEVRGLGNATPRLNFFFTGSGIGANKNYVSVASSQSPYTLASTNSATTPTATGVAGFTKFRDATSFLLVIANSTPFKFNNFLISSTALPENTGLSAGLNDAFSSNDIIVNADFSTYTTANLTIREPTIAVNPLGYKAYPTTNPSFNTYYCLQTITLGATNYIDATRANGEPGFASGLDLRGTPNANNLFTTSSTLGTTTITTSSVGAIFNGGASGYYFCSTNSTNLVDNFIVGTTIAPDTRVIYNTATFDKGSLTISKLDFRVAPTASTPVVNSSIVTSWYIRSNSTDVGGGNFETQLYFRTTTRITTGLLAVNQFFINSVTATTFNNSGLNGAYITSFTQEPTLNCFKATFRGKTNMTATTQKGGDLGIFQISTLVYRIDTMGLYVPAVNDFIRIATRTNVNNIRSVSSLGSNLYDLTLEYTEGVLGSGFTYVITSPVTTTASLLQTTAITAYEAHNLVVYTIGSTYSYYPETNLYSAFAPMTINAYDGIAGTPLAIQPIQYTIQTPFTYNYITPLSITDYGRTSFSLYPTETITFYTFFDINLPPNQANTTLVSVDAIQTLTNKTFDRIGLQTITNQTSTQLGYTIRNKLPNNTLTTANTWLQPSGNLGQITLASQGVYLLSYSFTSRTTTAVVLMGALTLSNTLNSVYTSPVGTNVPSSVFAFCGQTNLNANYNTCANSYVYVNTSTNVTIYLWWATSVVNQVIQGEGGYFQAVRIA